MEKEIVNIIIFFISGCSALCGLTITVYKTGIVHKTRDSSGHLNNKQSMIGFFILVVVFLLITIFFVLFGIFTFDNNSSYIKKLILTLILMLLLVLFDSFFIDLFVIGKLRPLFLNIPQETTMETMKIHVKKTFSLGWMFIVPIILISVTIVHLIHY